MTNVIGGQLSSICAGAGVAVTPASIVGLVTSVTTTAAAGVIVKESSLAVADAVATNEAAAGAAVVLPNAREGFCEV